MVPHPQIHAGGGVGKATGPVPPSLPGSPLPKAATCLAALPEGLESFRHVHASQPRFPRGVVHNFPFCPHMTQPDISSRRRRKWTVELKFL